VLDVEVGSVDEDSSNIPFFCIREYSPAAEEIWRIDLSPAEGYAAWDRGAGEVVFLDTQLHDSKLRPDVLAVYAGGKATNVARVLGELVSAPASRTAPRCEVRLETFLPAAAGNPVLEPTPGGGYVEQLLRDLKGVRSTIRLIEVREPLRKDRRAIQIVSAEGGELLNLTPRLSWSVREAAQALESTLRPCGARVAVLAGSPPLGAEDLYARVIRGLRARPTPLIISVDTSGAALASILADPAAHPDVICINAREYEAQVVAEWAGFGGTILVHDRDGCWCATGIAIGTDNARVRVDVAALDDLFGPACGPTLGAGDAAHAGFLYGHLLLGLPLKESAVLSMAAAAGVIRSPIGLTSFRGGSADRYASALAKE